jgi:hypothetical protein
MKSTFLSSLLALTLLPPFALAQRTHGGSGGGSTTARGNYGPSGNATVDHGRPGFRGRPGPCGFGDCFGPYGPWQDGYGYWPGYYAPYFADYDGFWTLQESPPQPPPAAATPSVIVMQLPEPKQQPAPVEPPKLVEVPSATDTRTKDISDPAPAPPAIFILSSGERLQATRYTLTYDSLRIPQGRGVRMVPLTALDMDATLAANRQRGVDLQIPENRQQITLGF